MKELKPQLIITRPGRKRRGFGSFFLLVIVFAAGFYFGIKYDEYYAGNWSSGVQSREEAADGANDKVTEIQNAPAQENMASLYSEESMNTGNTGKEETSPDSMFPGGRMLDGGDTSESTERPGTEAGSVEKNDIGSDNEAQLSEVGINVLGESGSDAASGIRGEANAPENTKVYAYTLQVAALSTPEEAEVLLNEYRDKGYEAYIVAVENSRGEKWNLVKIGKFKTLNQAWEYSADFQAREGREVYVESVGQDTVFNESWDQRSPGEQ